MIAKEELPEDPAEWGPFEVSFPRLDPDTVDSCPGFPSEILEYVNMVAADARDVAAERLDFIRTAQVGHKRCWIWAYADVDGGLAYVTYWQEADGGTTLGMSDAKADPGALEPLSPEQYMLAEYYELVYW